MRFFSKLFDDPSRRLWAVVLSVACLCAVAAGQAASPAGAVAPQQTVSEKIAASKALLDINTATAEQLRALPGMGDAYVARIVAGRPYTAKNQLVTRGVIPQAAYEKVKDQIVAHRVKP